MSARAQDVTSKLLLDGRAANTVNLPTRPPLACLPVSLPLCLPPCLLALPVLCLPACLFACYANNFSPTPHTHSFTYDVGYIPIFFYYYYPSSVYPRWGFNPLGILIVAFLFPFFCSRPSCCCFLLRSYNCRNWCN